MAEMGNPYGGARTLASVRRRLNGKHWRGYLALLAPGDVSVAEHDYVEGDPGAAAEHWKVRLAALFPSEAERRRSGKVALDKLKCTLYITSIETGGLGNMTTLHPTAKRCGAGYVAMIIVRDAKGRVHGSRTGKLVSGEQVARLEAYFAAVVACAMLENCRVRP